MAARTEERDDPKLGWRKRYRSSLARRGAQLKTQREDMQRLDTILARIRERRGEIEQIGEETRALLSQLGVR